VARSGAQTPQTGAPSHSLPGIQVSLATMLYALFLFVFFPQEDSESFTLVGSS